MKRLFLFLALTAPALAQDIPPPSVVLSGLLEGNAGNYALVTSPNQNYIIKEGDKLGDYRVLQVGNHKVVFGYKDLVFPMSLPGGAAGARVRRPQPPPAGLSKALAQSEAFNLELAKADLIYAIKLVCKACKSDYQAGPEVNGVVTAHGKFRAGEALDCFMEGSKFDWVVHRDSVIVAERNRLATVVSQFEANLKALAGAPPQRVSMDFVGADFVYYGQICAKEMKLKSQIQPRQGNVTCLVRSRRAADVLALSCALQTPAVAASLHEGVLHLK